MTTKILNSLILPLLALSLMVGLAGCKTPLEYKAEADEEVYSVIDRFWQKDMGSRANYKISDTAPLPDDLNIKKTLPASGVLSLARAVAFATAHNRQYQTEKEALYLKALELTAVRHQFAPNPYGRGNAGYAREGPDEVIGILGALGFDQLLSSGAALSTNLALAWAEVLTGDLRSGLSAIFSAAITQPLLRGYGRKVALENLTQAERDTLYQLRIFNRFRQEFVVDVASRYYRVLQEYDALKNTRENYDTLNDLYDRSQQLAASGLIPQFELNQTYQDTLKARDTLIQAQRTYLQALDEFKIALSLPTRTELSLNPGELDTLRAVKPAVIDFPEDDILKTALSRRLDLANRADAVDDARRKIEVAADALRPELNLVAGMSEASSNSRADLTTLKALEDKYLLGAELDLPLDRLEERNAYRRALITLSQSIRDYEETFDQISLQIRQAYRELVDAALRYQVQTESLELARKRLENTRLLLNTRLANTRDVLDAQSDLFRAQNASTKALVDYTVASLNFYRDAGVLRVRPDGMWDRPLTTAQAP